MFTRAVDIEMVNNQYVINKNIKKQNEMQEEFYANNINNFKDISNKVKDLYQKINEISKNVVTKTITIPYEEYISLQQKEIKLNNLERGIKELVKEYNSTLKGCEIKAREYGQEKWKDLLLPLFDLRNYEYLLEEKNK